MNVAAYLERIGLDPASLSIDIGSLRRLQRSEMCDFQQYSPDSHFTKGKLCSIMTANGRKTLTDTKFIAASHGSESERLIGTEKEFNEVLAAEFYSSYSAKEIDRT
jgi:arylamine N-acetyltransferase